MGNEVIKNLVLFGLEHLVLVDFDVIEPSNLTRSILFSRADADARREKCHAAAERAGKINPDIKVLPITGNICHDIGLGLLRRMDVVVGCVDNRWARYCINRLCMRAGIPWVDGGIDGLEGTARVFAPGKNCYACNLGPEALKEMSYRLSCSSVIKQNEQAGRVPTTPVIASIIGGVEAQEAIKLLHRDKLADGELTSLCGKVFYYEGQHLTAKIADFRAYDDDCPVHEQWTPVETAEIDTRWNVGSVLEYLAGRYKSDKIEIILRDFSFVDYIVTRGKESRYTVMKPDHAVGSFISSDPVLRTMPNHAMNQHEIKTIDSTFPYPELSLSDIGIPAWDILQVRAGEKYHYLELSDEQGYSACLSNNDKHHDDLYQFV